MYINKYILYETYAVILKSRNFELIENVDAFSWHFIHLEGRERGTKATDGLNLKKPSPWVYLLTQKFKSVRYLVNREKIETQYRKYEVKK